MKVSYELKQGYIDVWNEESEEWDRYIKVNKESVVEEEKKIPEKLKLQIHHSNLPNLTLHEEQLEKNDNTLVDCFEEVEKKFNEIIDYLKSKGE